MTRSVGERSVSLVSRSLEDLHEACDKIANSAAGDTHAIASLMQKMNLDYYEDVRKQARQSFNWALMAALFGTGFFVYAAVYAMRGENTAWIGVIAGSLIQVISAINFYLYGRAARQFASFHICLERTNRFLLANTLCEKLGPPLQDQVRNELIHIVANAPMLTMEIVEGRQT